MEGSTAKPNPDHQEILGTNWRVTQNTLTSCKRIVEMIEDILIEVEGAGNGKHIKRDQLRKWLKQQKKEEELSNLGEKLKTYQNCPTTQSFSSMCEFFSICSESVC